MRNIHSWKYDILYSVSVYEPQLRCAALRRSLMERLMLRTQRADIVECERGVSQNSRTFSWNTENPEPKRMGAEMHTWRFTFVRYVNVHFYEVRFIFAKWTWIDFQVFFFCLFSKKDTQFRQCGREWGKMKEVLQIRSCGYKLTKLALSRCADSRLRIVKLQMLEIEERKLRGLYAGRNPVNKSSSDISGEKRHP